MGIERVERGREDPEGAAPTAVAVKQAAPRRAGGPSSAVDVKLVVGAASDPAEREADRTAAEVISVVQRWAAELSADGEHGRAEAPLGRQPLRVQPAGWTEPDGSSDGWIGPRGGALDGATSSRIQRARGGGRPLDAGVRRSMERGFGADFGDVRIHLDSEAEALNQRIQARAFTTGSDIFFRAGGYDPSTASGQQLLAHELAHVVQQGSGIARSVEPDGTSIIRRHASWEHKMLGDVDPATLEVIAAGRDVAAEDEKRKSWWASTRESAKTIRTEAGVALDMPTVLHTIDQEIRRLKLFQSNPPQGSVAEATAALEQLDAEARKQKIGADVVGDVRVQAERAIDDAKWGVRLVSLPLRDGTSFLVTYGELNTLADFYGSAAEISQTPADNFRGIVGGVREESIRKFMRLRNELAGNSRYDPDAAEHDIAGAVGNKGTLNGAGASGAVLNRDQYGELKLMGRMGNEKREEIDGRVETSYTAGLGRNACHFAPHSWHAWATAHKKAVALAQEAWQLTQQANRLEQQSAPLLQRGTQGDQIAAQYNQERRDEFKAQAADKLNAALIENGFGDHFLQDSYAAGHLVNKTLIMQWFATWLDSNRNKRDYTSPADWRQVQQVSYGQPGVAGSDLFDPTTIGQRESNDPQSVENLEGDWTARFDALGLQIPSVLRNSNTDEFRLFTWWQEEAMGGQHLAADWTVLQKAGPIKEKGALQEALYKLIDAGVVFYEHYSQTDRAQGARGVGLENAFYNKDLCIKREYIPKPEKAAEFRQAKLKASQGDTAEYHKMAKAVTYSDYHKFLNHGYLQLASNVLHDHFCANGLDVATGEDETPYRIYGDNAMLGKESSKMVKFSAETSHRSRDSIYEIATTGNTAHTTAAVAARFPTWVRPVKAPKNLSLAEWHGDGGALHRFCFDTIFPQVAALFSKGTAIASDTLTTKISKDATVAIHSGEAF